MTPVTSDPHLWTAAGGDAQRRDVLSRAGRLAAFSDGDSRCIAAIHPDRPTVGTIGDWVGGSEVLRAAEAWLASQGCRAVQGPALLAPWFPYRATLGPFEEPPLTLEPTERGERWASAGYAPVVQYVSLLTGHDPQIRGAVDRAAALGSRGWRIDPFETGPSSQIPAEIWDRSVGVLHEVASSAFANLPGYLSVPADVVADYYRPLRPLLDPRLLLIARDPAGKTAGFVLGAPDSAQPGRKWFQVLTLAVRPEYRGSGVASWLVAVVHQAARRAGYRAGVHTYLRVEDAGEGGAAWRQGEIIRRYALYERALTPTEPVR